MFLMHEQHILQNIHKIKAHKSLTLNPLIFLVLELPTSIFHFIKQTSK